jgi:hypothetical protein
VITDNTTNTRAESGSMDPCSGLLQRESWGRVNLIGNSGDSQGVQQVISKLFLCEVQEYQKRC